MRADAVIVQSIGRYICDGHWTAAANDRRTDDRPVCRSYGQIIRSNQIISSTENSCERDNIGRSRAAESSDGRRGHRSCGRSGGISHHTIGRELKITQIGAR